MSIIGGVQEETGQALVGDDLGLAIDSYGEYPSFWALLVAKWCWEGICLPPTFCYMYLIFLSLPQRHRVLAAGDFD